MPSRSEASAWNVPNALTVLRIVIVPFFGWALLAHGGESIVARLVAFVLFAVAMVTDKIDGDLARKHDLVTDFGKIADPIADKAITGMAFVGLSVIGELWWWVTIVVLVREWSVTLLRLGVLSRVVLPANYLGKVKTTAQGLALGGLCLPARDSGLWEWLRTPGEVWWWAMIVLLGAAVVLTVWSGIEFFWSVWRQRALIGSKA